MSQYQIQLELVCPDFELTPSEPEVKTAEYNPTVSFDVTEYLIELTLPDDV